MNYIGLHPLFYGLVIDMSDVSIENNILEANWYCLEVHCDVDRRRKGGWIRLLWTCCKEKEKGNNIHTAHCLRRRECGRCRGGGLARCWPPPPLAQWRGNNAILFGVFHSGPIELDGLCIHTHWRAVTVEKKIYADGTYTQKVYLPGRHVSPFFVNGSTSLPLWWL